MCMHLIAEAKNIEAKIDKIKGRNTQVCNSSRRLYNTFSAIDSTPNRLLLIMCRFFYQQRYEIFEYYNHLDLIDIYK